MTGELIGFINRLSNQQNILELVQHMQLNFKKFNLCNFGNVSALMICLRIENTLMRSWMEYLGLVVFVRHISLVHLSELESKGQSPA